MHYNMLTRTQVKFIESKQIPVVVEKFGKEFHKKLQEQVPNVLGPRANYEVCKQQVFPEFNSMSLPMVNQVDRHISSEAIKINPDRASFENEASWQKVHTKNDFQQNYRHLIPIKNKEHETNLKDIELRQIEPVPNDWQDPKIIPRLQNHLEILTRCPGIYPTESIVQFNKQKLAPFFGQLPQYSQINESLIAPYFTPGSDVNLKRIATKHKSKYLMSTSTITAMLNHIYYAISNFKSPHFSGLSESYDHEPLKFMLS